MNATGHKTAHGFRHYDLGNVEALRASQRAVSLVCSDFCTLAAHQTLEVLSSVG
jgi:hypothetical protein